MDTIKSGATAPEIQSQAQIIDLFRAAMLAAGLDYQGEIIPDAQLQRFKVNGDKVKNSWYVLHLDGIPAGRFGCNKRSIDESWYIIDSIPLSACDNIRIRRCRRYQGEAWRGYQASKRRYFYGLKIHLVVTAQGHPVEFFLTPGADSDAKALKQYAFDLPQNATITGDKAYNDYGYEDLLREAGLHLIPLRKKNSKRPLDPALTYLISTARKAVETTGSLIERLLPKHIHTVTATGFELKVGLFILACSLNFIF